MEPDGLAGDSRQSARGADRELDPVRLAALSARGSRPIARTQAGDPAYGDHVVMDETLGHALAALFRETGPISPPAGPAATSVAGPAADRAREALAHYDQAIARLKAGDWSGFGAELDAMRPLLQELSRPPAGPP